ncbi:hypothetical protein G5714_002738 [Onychostoma macrolepis]|uniref:DUF4371 domain-containing protein n=1 Tax=Onychostoma macrolepis TaxID=369639 RepID=A0A7J6D7I9_9TELE|nr:hypothetical protein G5714_002738 [Onychostoma macrolepis]
MAFPSRSSRVSGFTVEFRYVFMCLPPSIHHPNTRTRSLIRRQKLLTGSCETQSLAAAAETQKLLSFGAIDYSTDKIVSQCYDGACTMSGIRGWLQALLQKKLGRKTPYMHCYNHQLHLAVVHATQAEPCAGTFFDLSSALHSLFHRQYVIHNYDVPCFKRLETSHYDVKKCLVDSKEGVLAILSEVSHSEAVLHPWISEQKHLALCSWKRTPSLKLAILKLNKSNKLVFSRFQYAQPIPASGW